MGWILSTPFLLASARVFVSALIAASLIVIRAALEDRTLQAELLGYSEYAIRVHFRLMPDI
jgi:protein-S-isoprenylcysteine O-methyltransferase Ste14